MNASTARAARWRLYEHISRSTVFFRPSSLERSQRSSGRRWPSIEERSAARLELGVEPAAGLVRTFDDPVLRPPSEELVVPRRVAEARPTRDPAVEPDVDRVGDASHLAVALLAGQDDPVDARPMKVHS